MSIKRLWHKSLEKNVLNKQKYKTTLKWFFFVLLFTFYYDLIDYKKKII